MSEARRCDAEGSVQLSPMDQIDLVCDAFEEAWHRGDPPRIEDFLSRCDENLRGQLVAELLLIDRDYRLRRGEPANRQMYLARFPDYSTVIGELDFPTVDVRRENSGPHSHNAQVAPHGKIAQFELVEQLGEGASGIVWKALDKRLHRTVAIKIPRQSAATPSERERFLREAQACAQLRHPNIVAIYDIGSEHGRVFLVAELIDGLDLRKWLTSRKPTVRESTELVAQLAEALHHAHENGVIHRDLKPANVLIGPDGRPHITDFGLAKWSDSSLGLTVDGDILGTPAYMSPEQASGNAGHVDRRTDVYGLGAIFYELLTLRPPFEGDVAAVVHQVIHNEPAAPRTIDKSVPRDLETICLKALEKEPGRRYPSTQEMAVDLRRFLRGEPILARRTGVVTKSWRWLRRRPAAAAALVLGFVVLLAGLAIASLAQQNYQLQGYRQVRITTKPPGARVALVPVDERTGELVADPNAILRPGGRTPLTVRAKPGKYLVEAVLPGSGDTPDFSEAYESVPARDTNPAMTATILILPSKQVLAGMVPVPIDEAARHKHPLLPKVLYVDARQTRPSDGSASGLDTSANISSYFGATAWAEDHAKRLPTALECDLVAEHLKRLESNPAEVRNTAAIEGFFDDLAEWTSTKYNFPVGERTEAATRLRNCFVLKGFRSTSVPQELIVAPTGQLIGQPESTSRRIAFRGVRSGAPRFVAK